MHWQENVALVKRYLDGMLMHRLSGGSLAGADGIVQIGQTDPECSLCAFDQWVGLFGEYLDGVCVQLCMCVRAWERVCLEVV